VHLEPIPGRIAADPGHRLHGWRPSWVNATAPDAAHRDAGSASHPRHQRRRDGAFSVSGSTCRNPNLFRRSAATAGVTRGRAARATPEARRAAFHSTTGNAAGCCSTFPFSKRMRSCFHGMNRSRSLGHAVG
jgi:hypothetical protein